MWHKTPVFTNRMCKCGRQFTNVSARHCSFCDATENADPETKELINDILHNGAPATESDYDEAQEINEEINDVRPLQSAQTEPIRQPQRKHGPNRRREW